MSYKMKSKSGFTLIESLVALAILAIGMAGTGSLLHRSMNEDIYTDANRRMLSIAQEIIEDLRGQIAQLTSNQIENINLATRNTAVKQIWQNTGQNAGVNFVDMRGTAGGYVYKWLAEDHPSGTVRLTVTVAMDMVGQQAPQFPRDPDSPDFFKHKVVMTNFVKKAR